MSYLEAYIYISITLGIWALYIYHRDERKYYGDNINYLGKNYTDIPYMWGLIPLVVSVVWSGLLVYYIFDIVAKFDKRNK